MDKKRVCVVGATGSVGQEFIQSLNNHPWFELTQIAASPKSAGKNYLDAIKNADGIVQWEVDGDIPSYVKNMIVKNVDDIDTDNLDLMFSAVESEAARDIETKFAAILPVISTSSAYRYETDVPILIPGINDDHADLLDVQKKNRNWKGWVAPLPNCTTTGLAITLKPLYEKYGAKKVMMTSMQAISGGGRSPGVSAMQINDNIIPYIAKEEAKVRIETRKILGKINGDVIKDADIKVSSTCTRVPVIDGHTSVFVETSSLIQKKYLACLCALWPLLLQCTESMLSFICIAKLQGISIIRHYFFCSIFFIEWFQCYCKTSSGTVW